MDGRERLQPCDDALVMPLRRPFHHHDFDPALLAHHKRAAGLRVSVCLPARNEEATVGDIVACVRRRLVESLPLVDELVVLDDGSTDRTAEVARAAGARVVTTASILPELTPPAVATAAGRPPGLDGAGADGADGDGTEGAGGPVAPPDRVTSPGGKGEALWKSLYVTRGDLVCWIDADITDFTPRFVVGLLGPLLTVPQVGFVKGFYRRPHDGTPDGGGRVTELVARPLISKLFPHLAEIVQPLSGEYAGRRELLEQVPFVQGWGVELGLLVDLVERFGPRALAQVDLDVRTHRNRPVAELAPQAMAILSTALRKAGVEDDASLREDLVRYAGDDGGLRQERVSVAVGERPPMATVPAYRRMRERAAWLRERSA